MTRALHYGIIDNYWNNSESYEALENYIVKDFDVLKDTIALLMDGGSVKVDLFHHNWRNVRREIMVKYSFLIRKCWRYSVPLQRVMNGHL